MNKRLLVYLFLAVFYTWLLISLYTAPTQKTVEEEGSIHFFSCQEINCAQLYIDLLEQSQVAHCAFYDLTDTALIAELTRHTDAQIKIFAENYEEYFSEQFISVESRGLMHHKFCVLDELITITGSYNPTLRGGSVNDNYVLVFYSPSVAQAHLKEYEQIGEQKEIKQNKLVNLSGTLIELCFSPQGNCEENIIREINGAQNNITFLAFSFTSKKIGEALIQAQQKNISVQGIYEKTRVSQYSTYADLLAHNITVYLDTNSATMHEKLFLIDNQTLIVGSYNPTASANTKNDENLIIIKKSPIMAQVQGEYKRLTVDLKTLPE